MVTGRWRAPAVCPQGIEPRIVHGHEPADRVAGSQPEQLPDLETARASSGRIAQPGGFHLPEVRALRPHRVVEPREHGDPVRERLPVLELAPERVAPAAVEVDDRRDVRGVERRREVRRRAPLPAVGERGRAEVVVGVDRRERRALRDSTVAGPKLGARPEVGQAEVVGRPSGPLGHVDPYPLSPDRVMPRTKYFWAITKRTIIGRRLTRAPAIISGHLPTNWPWKNASPTVVV